MHNDTPIEIDCPTVCTKLSSGKDFLLIDCREPEEHAIAHIASARLLPMSQLASRLDELEPFRGHEIAVHCHHGGRSLKVAHWLRSQGYANAQSMTGGIDQWAQDIDPTLARY